MYVCIYIYVHTYICMYIYIYIYLCLFTKIVHIMSMYIFNFIYGLLAYTIFTCKQKVGCDHLGYMINEPGCIICIKLVIVTPCWSLLEGVVYPMNDMSHKL